MTKSTNGGFTLIESMLFLAISGLISIGIMVGAMASINQQRYRDASNSLVDYFQGELNLVLNVQNDQRADSVVCNSGGVVVGGADEDRGTSDCSLVGRIVYSKADSKGLISKTVLATADITESTAGVTEIEALRNANLVVSELETKDYDLEWGAGMAETLPTPELPRQFSMLIVRSPTTGLLRTYSVSLPDRAISDILDTADPSRSMTVCINSNGLTGGRRNGVVILGGASNSSGVKFINGGQC
ncbi:MAG: hypothetical protein WBB94_02830 [Candidatus Saccharimonadaceae bacterium]